MKFVKQGIFTLALLSLSQPSNAAFYYYFGADAADDGSTNTAINVVDAQSAWQAKVSDLFPTLSVSTFTTNYANVSTSTGLGFSNTDTNVNLSNSADYTSSNSPNGTASFSALSGAGTPSFNITATEKIDNTGDGVPTTKFGGVFYSDVPTGKTADTAAAWQDILSIGKFNGFASPGNITEYDNDDFTLDITGGDALYAFAFKIINNNKYNGNVTESLDIFDSSSTLLAHIGDDSNDGIAGIGTSTNIPGYNSGEGEVAGVDFVQTSFIGIVTDNIAEAFSSIMFDEDGNANDIGIFELQFLVAAPVPVPAAVWLFGTGLLFLFGFRRKQALTS